MLNVIRFLEKMGSEAHWRDANLDELEAALADAEVEAPMRSAILNKDGAELQALLHQPQFVSTVIPAVPEEEEDEEEDEEPGEQPKPKDMRSSLQSSSDSHA
ncbi:hypothetical protein [Dyella acidisoli]|uniref:Uncharacterized protein n=1 Tax=Dyella acidisoli TaxID=1867834 RepID=A0ABQ5XNU6_9GAMM|nr:hypothetical protein [Dyella acidisoli]GLQ92844.1 hypothetical protein GCM10007901_17950 [Dyella acidisoli]